MTMADGATLEGWTRAISHEAGALDSTYMAMAKCFFGEHKADPMFRALHAYIAKGITDIVKHAVLASVALVQVCSHITRWNVW